jgi:transcriptional regulator GlxA family with amidase domain
MNSSTPEIAILVFPETTASVVYGMQDLFLSAGRDWGVVTEGTPGPGILRPLLVARNEQPIDIAHGVRLTPAASFDRCGPAPIVCVPEVYLPPQEPLAERFDAEIAWLRERYEDGATLATSCSGAMLLAEAGLLDGQEATTHWAWCSVLEERFPRVTVRPQRALVVSGEGQRLIMAGGGTSWMDLGLYIIARTVGLQEAIRVARVNLIDWHNIGQQPFARLARTRQVEDADIARCQTWLAEHYDRRNPVSALVEYSGLPERSCKRRFQQATGMSPLEYVHSLRLEEAKHLLETGDLSVETIANEVGYEDPAFFSRLFRRKVNLTPAQYRRRFSALREALPKASHGGIL